MTDVSLQPILALLGCPVAGNPTQYMMEKAFAHHGLEWRYLSVEVIPEALGDAVCGMQAMGFAGGNCAEPHKQAVVRHLARLSPVAEMAGVVNCIVREAGELVGENTEGKALLQCARRRLDPTEKRFVLLGAGQLARSIGIELALAGAEQLTVVSRNEEAGRSLAGLLKDHLEVSAALVVWHGEYAIPGETDVLIHATTIGQGEPEAPVPINVASLSEHALVVDSAFNPPDSWLLAQADAHGCSTIDGLEVFLTQAAINFQLWTGVEPNAEVLREAVEEYLEL